MDKKNFPLRTNKFTQSDIINSAGLSSHFEARGTHLRQATNPSASRLTNAGNGKAHITLRFVFHSSSSSLFLITPDVPVAQHTHIESFDASDGMGKNVYENTNWLYSWLSTLPYFTRVSVRWFVGGSLMYVCRFYVWHEKKGWRGLSGWTRFTDVYYKNSKHVNMLGDHQLGVRCVKEDFGQFKCLLKKLQRVSTMFIKRDYVIILNDITLDLIKKNSF